MNSKVYKWCAVPLCQNTSISTPKKLFVYVPNKKIIRDKWLTLARRNPNDVVTNSPLYFCEDHFDLPNDMKNYMEYHIMGSVSQVRMKPGCIPKKFICQPDRITQTSDTTEQPFMTKKRKKVILQECDMQSGENSMVTEHLHYEEIASGSSATTQESDVEPNASKNEDDAEDGPDSRSDTLSASPVEYFEIKTENLYEDMEDMSMYEDYATSAAEPDVVKPKEEESYHTSQCNVCNEEITGFRYTCVQCSDFDLCSACENNKAHHHHYVLRVPQCRPNDELEAVLTLIRLHLLKDLDPIKEPESEEITIKMEETTEATEMPSELVEKEDKSEEMDKIIEANVPLQTEQDTCSVDANKSASYKCCGVPLCLNTTVKTPGKLFITVPTKRSARQKWLKLARRNPNTVHPVRTLHFCEDHFDLPNDMENYMQYHIMGSVSQIRMKSGCVPSKFICNTDWGRRSYTAEELNILEKRKKLMIKDPVESNSEPSIGTGAANRTAAESNTKTADKSTQDLNTTPEKPSNETNTKLQKKQGRKKSVEEPAATNSDSASTSVFVQLRGKMQQLRVVAGNFTEANIVTDVMSSSRPRPLILRRRVTRPPNKQMTVVLQRKSVSDDRTDPATQIT